MLFELVEMKLYASIIEADLLSFLQHIFFRYLTAGFG
jgi:hypothetical protein